MTIRPSARLGDVLEIARAYLVVPGCDVDVIMDESPPQRVGYASPKAALEAVLQVAGFVIGDAESEGRRRAKVVERQQDGATIAYALTWSHIYHEWAFVTGKSLESRSRRPRHWTESAMQSLGICIEGVRVEFTPPGYREGDGIAAIVNATGPSAPKTNVARSGFESTRERDDLLQFVYATYCGHIRDEMTALQERGAFSLTWIVTEGGYLVDSLLRAAAAAPKLLFEQIDGLPLVLVESAVERQAVSIQSIRDTHAFWTVHCEFFRSAEYLIREAPGSGSLRAIIGALNAESLELPTEPVVCHSRGRTYVLNRAFRDREIDLVRIDRTQRRLDLRWVPAEDPPRWRGVAMDSPVRARMRLTGALEPGWVLVGVGGIEIEGAQQENVVVADQHVYLLPGRPLSRYAIGVLDRTDLDDDEGITARAGIFEVLRSLATGTWPTPIAPEQLRGAFERHVESQTVSQLVDFNAFADAVNQSGLHVFDPSAWVRKEA